MDRNDLLAASRAEFMRCFTKPLDEIVSRGVAHLFRKADSAPTLPEQGRFLDARAVLLSQEVALKRQLAAAMDNLLNRSFQTAYSTFRPSFGGGLSSSNALSLIDTSAFEDELHIDEVTKRFRQAAEDQLRDLNIRIALLFEQDEIRERENPFRPYLLARCILVALEDIDVSPELMQPLGAQIADDLIEFVPAIYDDINELLAKNGIAAQLQLKIRKTPESAAALKAATSDEMDVGSFILPSDSEAIPKPSFQMLDDEWDLGGSGRADELINWVQGGPDAGSLVRQIESHGQSQAEGLRPDGGKQRSNAPMANRSDSSAEQPRKGWLAGAKAVGEVLRDFFTGKSRMDGTGLPEDYEGFEADDYLTARPPTRLTESVHSLQQSSTPPAAAMLHSDGRIRNLILEHRDELSVMSRDDEEQMIIDIVAMLFEFILRDSQVPAEVRAQLGRLQFLVLKVALLDPALFSQKSHPARLLVNRIGSIVLGLKELDPGGERVTGEICRIVEILLSDITGDVSLFAQMLDEFDSFVTHELRAADQNVDRAVQALENAQNRTVQFAHISGMISEAISSIKIDQYLHDFLVNTWSRVIERAGRDDEPRAKRLRILVPDLVWSIIPKSSEQDRKQLFGLIPVLLSSIKEGVALLGWTEMQQEALLDWLIEAHRHALRTGNMGVQVPPLSHIYECFEGFINTQKDLDTESDAGWDVIDGKLLDEAISEMEADLNVLDQMFDLDMTELMAPGGVGSPEDNAPVITGDEIADRLRTGVVIDIMLESEPTRARLSWISQSAANLVITIEDVPVPTVVNAKVFRRLLETGRVRFVEDAPLFERAMHSLLESADKLDHAKQTAD